jgi:hypothetical protein
MEAGIGKATVTVSFPDWKEGKVTSGTIEIEIADRSPGGR